MLELPPEVAHGILQGTLVLKKTPSVYLASNFSKKFLSKSVKTSVTALLKRTAVEDNFGSSLTFEKNIDTDFSDTMQKQENLKFLNLDKVQ